MAEGRIAVVPPRYGDDVVGGSEAVLREAAHGLAARGWEVEVLTTCVRDHYTWANDYPPGSFTTAGLTVRRFPVVRDTNRSAWARLTQRVVLGLALSPEEQLVWINGNFRVPDLFHHLLANGDSYRAVILSPYLFWTTVVGSAAVPGRTVVVPCLHDEPYAYLDVFRPLLGGAAQVWFLSEPEHHLAHRLGPVAPSHHLVGSGVPVPAAYDPDGFRARHGLRRPFVLYAGRREAGKGWDDLLAGFAKAVKRLGIDLDLVSVGVGEASAPPDVAHRVIDLGYLPPGEIDDAFAAAAAYLQPSRNESFSRTIMEAWLAGTPVIASAASDVVAWHCQRSGAGLVYQNHDELAQCLALVAESPRSLAGLAARGREYVLTHYTWDSVLDRMEKALEEFTGPPAVEARPGLPAEEAKH
jgi:glycosyltransferase involved in cell wall biosynthesis